jgi:hypothetical protein
MHRTPIPSLIVTLLSIVFLTGGFSLRAACQQKSNSELKSVDIEFTYIADGKNSLYKPEKYDIVIEYPM